MREDEKRKKGPKDGPSGERSGHAGDPGNEETDYNKQDYPVVYDDRDDQYLDEYDEYLEEGYEDDHDKDYPEDYDLEYLKRFEEHDDGGGDGYTDERPRKSPLLRVVALVTVLAFLGLAVAASLPATQFPLAELVGKSLQLQKDIDVQRLQAAVVQIDVVSRQGISFAGGGRSGTGFNIKPGGFIVTNHHVIDGALNMTITFPDGGIYPAESWASKPELDLAVIKLRTEKELPVAPVDFSGLPGQGDGVRVVGNPLGLNNLVVEGKIEGYMRLEDRPELVFSIDVPVYPGNSGSPVFGRNGEVIGVVFARYHRQVDGEEKIFGLAVPIKEILDIETGKKFA
ncbi:MAG: S1C family serine protease [Firmicutes bacterium]|nr:S1C family serine protease [Bacillota bacterium]